jgi:hypothetical protein
MPTPNKKCKCDCLWCAHTNPARHDICGFDCIFSHQDIQETHKELIQEAESSGYQRGLHESCIKVDKEMLAFLRDHNESGDFLKKLNAETYQKGYEEGMKQQSDWDVEGLGLAEIRDRVVEKALASYKEELVKIIEQVEYPLAAMMEDLVVYNHRKEGGKTMKNRILRKFSSIIDIIKK